MDVGHLGVDDDGDCVVLRMLALLPEVQRRGLGTAIVSDVLRRANARGKPVSVRVTEQNVGARRLYERLGFRAMRIIDEPRTQTRKVEMES